MEPRIYTFATPGTTRLRAEIQSGDLDISTHDASETVVEVHPASTSSRAEEAVDQVSVEHRESGGAHEVTIDSRGGKSFGFGSGRSVRVRVRCPLGTHLDLRLGSADARAAGTYGSARVRSGSGDVELGEITRESELQAGSGDVRIDALRGPAKLQTGSGDVQLGHASGPVRAQLGSGDFALARADGPVEAKTGSGDARIDAVAEGSIRVNSGTGDVAIGILSGALVRFDVKSSTGDVISDLDVGDTLLPGDADGRQLEVYVRTATGDVRIRRA